ncbi:unnamed protein product [Cylindrotheca closterium]|uniref:AB hydrolase-1 domain-containing protein n=1 Tax=Cylindrotheca closterium TaxID=2856 RepID=A0AAD2G753_9STRA|nr:unnamed protein product [Cylindrotheca closterium]
MLCQISRSKKRRLTSSVHQLLIRSQCSGANATVPLYSEVIPNQNESGSHTVFLHGLLGNGRNLKTFAKQVCKETNSTGYLMDLRGHGKSRLPTTNSDSTASFAVCAQDVAQATESIPVTSIVGHSWGGRMALQYAAKKPSESLERVWLLDTVPGKANSSVEQVIDTVDQVVTNIQNSSSGTMDRKQIVQELTTAGLDQGIAMWLASSFDGSDFGFDLSVVHDILPEFGTQDFYGLLDEILSQNIKVDLVRGGKNQEWNSGPDGMSTLRELEEIQQQYPDKFATHVLPKAGHWVHVDDMKGLVQLFATK